MFASIYDYHKMELSREEFDIYLFINSHIRAVIRDEDMLCSSSPDPDTVEANDLNTLAFVRKLIGGFHLEAHLTSGCDMDPIVIVSGSDLGDKILEISPPTNIYNL